MHDALALGSKFGKYKPEEEKDVRKVEVKEDEVLKKLKDAWRRYKHVTVLAGTTNEEKILRAVVGIAYSARDVERFSLALVEFQDELLFPDKASTFLNTIIKNCKDSNYVIHTGHLKTPIGDIGMLNTKNITVNGNVGHNVGCFMKGGTITINGDATDSLGAEMSGGAITVNGNTGDCVGSHMRGGTIIVNGNAGKLIGEGMLGGEIQLNGDYRSIAKSIRKRKIYHKGKLIVDK